MQKKRGGTGLTKKKGRKNIMIERNADAMIIKRTKDQTQDWEKAKIKVYK